MLPMRIGLEGSIEICDGNLVEMIVPAITAAIIGRLVVLLGSWALVRLPRVRTVDAIAPLNPGDCAGSVDD